MLLLIKFRCKNKPHLKKKRKKKFKKGKRSEKNPEH